MLWRKSASLLAICVLALAVAAQKHYTFTIYVNKGKGSWHGHVWVGLSDGTTEGTHGFNPADRQLLDTLEALRTGTFGARIEDESKEHWDIRKMYSITEVAYHRSLDAINKSRASGEEWCPLNHCGNWAKRIAEEAGIHVDLPWYDFNRPGAFGNYLRDHNGETYEAWLASQSHDQAQELLTPPAKDVVKQVAGPLTGQEFERERQKYLATYNAASETLQVCLKRIPICFDSCVAGGDTSTIGKWLARETQCQQQCGNCKAEEAADLEAQHALSDFEKANNYGYPKKQDR